MKNYSTDIAQAIKEQLEDMDEDMLMGEIFRSFDDIHDAEA